MTDLDAIMKIEGEYMDDDELAECVQTLINSGTVWQLQGSYGRLAAELIENGMCYPKGTDPT